MINAASAASIKVSAGEDLLLAGGYAFRIDLGKGNALDIGVGAKGFVRGEIPPTFGIIDLSQVLGDLSSIFRESFILTTGVGVDLGIRWSLDDSLAAAIVCHDIYSPAVMTEYESVDAFTKDPAAAKIGVSNGKLPCLLDIGFLWSPRLGSLASVIDRVCFLLDYGDILDLFSPIPRNPVLNVRLGAEAQVLEIVTVRVGIKEALLNAGIGMDLGIFTVNMCALGTELGLDPGDRPAYNLQLSFEFVY